MAGARLLLPDGSDIGDGSKGGKCATCMRLVGGGMAGPDCRSLVGGLWALGEVLASLPPVLSTYPERLWPAAAVAACASGVRVVRCCRHTLTPRTRPQAALKILINAYVSTDRRRCTRFWGVAAWRFWRPWLGR